MTLYLEVDWASLSVSAWPSVNGGVSGEWAGEWLSLTKVKLRISVEVIHFQRIRLSTISHVLGNHICACDFFFFSRETCSLDVVTRAGETKGKFFRSWKPEMNPCKAVMSAHRAPLTACASNTITAIFVIHIYCTFIYCSSSWVAHTVL